MDKKLLRKLLRTGLVSSPIMALYGVTPVYLFNEIPATFIAYAAIGLLINVVLFWIVNIWIIRIYAHHPQTWKRWILSYACTLFMHMILIFFRVVIFKDEPVEQSLKPYGEKFIAYPFISVLAINTIILIICNSVLLAYKKERAELEIEDLKVTNLEAQKKVLMQQLQPHFLFNTLSVLKSLIRQNADEAEGYVLKLSEFLRYTVQVHNSTVVSLQEELKFTQDYIELQKMRFEQSMFVTFNIPADVGEQRLPAYALQTLVENAIKHNAFTEKKPLHINIGYSDGAVTVRNNKLLSRAEASTGSGLKNLDDRYKLIAGETIHISADNHQFCVTVPLLSK